MFSLSLCCVYWSVFFFKQKTAYEMRISDWSQTCALPISPRKMHETPRLRGVSFQESEIWGATQCGLYTNPDMLTMGGSRSFLGAKWKISSTPTGKIGRASCRERVCQYV